MKISKNFDESKLFSSVRFYDGLPLVEEDLHQIQDKERFKTKQLLSEFYYQGVFGDSKFLVEEGKLLIEKSLINLDGEIYIITGDEGSNIEVPLNPLGTDISDQIDSICIEGFFEEINQNSVVNAYGGLDNLSTNPELVHPTLGIQVSTRYQFKWRLRILEGVSDLSLIAPRDKSGVEIGDVNYSKTDEEKSLLTLVDPRLDVHGNKQYLIRLFKVHRKDYKDFDSSDIIHEETARYHRSGNNWMGAKRITLGEMKEDQVKLFEMKGMPLDIFKIKTL